MARLRGATTSTGHRIAVVDDDPMLVSSTVRLLHREGHETRTAASPDEAVELVKEWSPHLVLLDYYLTNGTGEAVVRRMREFDDLCQVLLVTGYAAEQPARKLLAELDIQGYHDKGDGPHRLMILVDAALKHWKALRRIDQQRRQLRHILDVAPSIAQLQPVPELLQRALRELGGLLRGGDGLIATTNSGLFVLGTPAEEVSIRAATGRFAGTQVLSQLAPEVTAVVRTAMAGARPSHVGGYVVVPLRTRDDDRGCMIIEAEELPEDAEDACSVYARQVVQALENVMLYERATVDALTGLHTRAFGTQRLDETLRLGTRTSETSSVLLVDVDHFKRVNDTFGHAAGDIALRRIGAAIRETCRSTDVCVRYGGEEMLVILPATDDAGARTIAERLRLRVAEERVAFEASTLTFTVSIGIASTTPRTANGEDLLRAADRALYRAKSAGRNRVASAADERSAAAA